MRIGILAPARTVDPQRVAQASAFAAIDFPAAELVVDPQNYVSEGHFAGSDAVRAAAFVRMANDPAIDAIWFARGGYGANRILDKVLPQLGEAARAKTYLGYSDAGFLLGALYAAKIGRAVHGPMLTDISRDGGDATVARALGWLISRDHRGLEPSLGGAPAAAFNLAILTALAGTPFMPDLADHVLMIEEVSEPLYRIDRMLFQLAHATQLKGIAGIRLGRINDIQPNDPPFGETPQQMIEHWCAEMRVPFLGTADIGHDADNKVVPFGVV